MRNLLLLSLLGYAFHLSAQSSTEASTQLHQLFEHIEKAERQPQDSLYRGFHTLGPWDPSSEAFIKENAEKNRGFREKLRAISDDLLDEQDRISKAVMDIKLSNRIANVVYRMHLIPFNAEGGFYNRLSFVLPRLPFNVYEDYKAYFGWLPHYASSLRENTELLRKGLKEGIIAPQPIVTNTISLLEEWAVKSPEASPLFEPMARMPAGFSESKKKELFQLARTSISEVNDAYSVLDNFLKTAYQQASPQHPGVGALPGGMDYYQNRVQHYTTLPLTADSVHHLGLQEVARIRASMDSIIRALDFEGSYAEFLAFLRTDKQFYPKTGDELLRRAAWISKKAEEQLPKYFGKLYSLPFTVAPVPPSIESTYTAGRYVGGSWPQQRAGTYWVNTYNLPSRTLYTLPALTLHEAVPGHHLQNALAAELKRLPDFRKSYYISAFGEGWGLYSEYLGEEMGIYTTPYELFGRYTYEMWRACRLVIDTGIHAKGWSRKKALEYLARNTALSLHEVTTEIDRYIGWPGQALSYKIGEIHIKNLRNRAESRLGDRFDVRGFHDVLLQNGSVPLAVLTDQIERWIETR